MKSESWFFCHVSGRVQVCIILALVLAITGCDSGPNAPSGSLTGHVYDVETATPLSGVLVSIGEVTSTTGIEGAYTLENLPIGMQTVTAQSPGYSVFTSSVAVATGTTILDVILGHATGVVSGIVTELDSANPLPDVTVSIGSVTIITGSDGAYRLDDLPVGTQTLTATRSGFNEYSAQIEIVETVSSQHDIVLSSDGQNVLFHGRVTNLRGKGLEGAWIWIAGLEQRSSATGSFSFPGIQQGQYKLEVAASNYPVFSQEISLLQTDVEYDIRLEARLLDAPSDLTARTSHGIGLGEYDVITVKWIKNSSSDMLMGYSIYRSFNGSAFELLAASPLAPPITEVVERDLSWGTYRYRVYALNMDLVEGLPAETEDATVATIEFVRISAGTFMMGSNNGKSYEKPVHSVTLSYDFWISKYEITQREYRAVTTESPSVHGGASDRRPVDNVNWYKAIKFANAMSISAGLSPCYDGSGNSLDGDFYSCAGYRLPTEAEWEYATRAGTATEFFFGDDSSLGDDYGWYTKLPGFGTHVVGLKKPNPWGLYDLYGNVWEWTNDLFSYSYYSTSPALNPTGPTWARMRVMRGGSVIDGTIVSSAARTPYEPAFGVEIGSPFFPEVGIRLTRTVQ